MPSVSRPRAQTRAPVRAWIQAPSDVGLERRPSVFTSSKGYEDERKPETGLRGLGVDLRVSLDKRHAAVPPRRELPHLQDRVPSELRSDRVRHPGLPGHRVALAACGGPLRRSPADALLVARRHPLHVRRPPHHVGRVELPRARRGRVPPRHRILGLSSRVVTRRAHGLGRAARARSIALPGRRQRRGGAGSTGRGGRRLAVGPPRPRGLLAARPGLHLHSGRGGALVPPPWPLAPRGEPRPAVARGRGPLAGPSRRLDGGAPRAHLLEVHLPGELHELLHVLSDAPLRRLRTERPAAPLRAARGGGLRNVRRRPAGRPLRSQAGHLVLDPGRPSVHARPALRPVSSAPAP